MSMSLNFAADCWSEANGATSENRRARSIDSAIAIESLSAIEGARRISLVSNSLSGPELTGHFYQEPNANAK
jgi:hypothetical protein